MSTSARIRHRAVPVPGSPQLERVDARPADTPTDQRPQTRPATAKAGPVPVLRPR